MKSVKCKACGTEVSKREKYCTNCGYKLKKIGLLQYFLIIFLGFIGFSILINIISPNKSPHHSFTKIKPNNNTLQSRLNYLNEIEEVTWVEIDDNDVYIGFSPIPSDLETICNAAAFHGNKAIDFGVHVWAIDARRFNKGWRPGDGSYVYEVTYRYGKKED